MSVTCLLTSVTSEQLRFLFAHPEQIDNFLRAQPAQKRSWFWSLFHQQTRVPDEISDLSSRQQLDMGKSCEAIHFVLTGTDSEDTALPAGTLLAAGDDIGEEDVGYGPARGIDAPRRRELRGAPGDDHAGSVRDAHESGTHGEAAGLRRTIFR
jgi:uncharacterized protein DUF1877